MKTKTEQVKVSGSQVVEKVKQLMLPAAKYRQVGNLPGQLDLVVRGSQAAVVVEDAQESLLKLQTAGIIPQVSDLNLDEIFEAYVIGRPEGNHDRQADMERVA